MNPFVPRARTAQAPTSRVETGPTVPTWALHVALAVTSVGAVCAAAAGTALTGGTLALLLVVLLAASARAAWQPSAAPAVVALAATGLACLAVTPTHEVWRFPVIIVCVHALVRLSWYTSTSALDSRIEVAVLRHEARTFVPLDLAGQGLCLLTLAATGLRTEDRLAGPAVLGVAGALALLALAVLLLGPWGGRRQERVARRRSHTA